MSEGLWKRFTRTIFPEGSCPRTLDEWRLADFDREWERIASEEVEERIEEEEEDGEP